VAVGILARLGYQAEVVGNGSDAVEAVARGNFEAVLMDCQLPGLDGYQASAEIRRREGDDHIPIIAMTAATLPDDRARCLAAGMDDFVSKPVMATELEATLSRWVGPAAPAGTPPRPDLDPPGGPELLELFWGTVSSDLASLRAAVEIGDASGIDRAAHHLKGAAVTVGLERVVELCRRLELLGGAGQLGPASAVLDQLEEEFAR
jgi:two-component system, sensor histidine kinase and response regulator